MDNIAPATPANDLETALTGVRRLREALLPSFAMVGVALRVSPEDHDAIRAALEEARSSVEILERMQREAVARPAAAPQITDALLEDAVQSVQKTFGPTEAGYAEAMVRKGFTLGVAAVGGRASTPAARWRTEGEPDPHAGHYDVERAKLTLGHLTDDELANEAFLHYDHRPSMQELMNPNAAHRRPIVLMTAVKERIRWLSRALERVTQAREQSAGTL